MQNKIKYSDSVLLILFVIILILSVNIHAQNTDELKDKISKHNESYFGTAQDSNITLLGTWLSSNTHLGEITYNNNYVYVTSGDSGLRIFNVSDPSNPLPMGHCCNIDVMENNIFVQNNYAYTVGTSYDWSTGYFRIIDITSSTNPIEVGCYDLGEWAWGVHVKDSFAYVIQHFGGLKILDISDPTAPTEIGFCQSVDWGEDIFVRDNYAFVVGTIGSGWVSSPARFCTIDISDPTNPSILATYDVFIDFITSFRQVFISGDYAYLICTWHDWEGYYNGCRLEILDISDPSQPTNISYYDAWANDVYVSGEYAYIAGDEGILILDIQNPSIPNSVGYYETGRPNAVSVFDNLIYASDSSGLFILQNNLISGLNKVKSHTPNFVLKNNYPNPFNPSTTIEFQIPKTEFVTLKIFNIIGQQVATLVSDKLTPGNYKYTWDASAFASGVYIYKLITGNGFEQSKKLVLLR